MSLANTVVDTCGLLLYGHIRVVHVLRTYCTVTRAVQCTLYYRRMLYTHEMSNNLEKLFGSTSSWLLCNQLRDTLLLHTNMNEEER